jgi:hypothetical protein
MELNQPVWFRRDSSHWGWVPAVIVRKEEVLIDEVELINLTLVNDRSIEGRPFNANGRALHFTDQVPSTLQTKKTFKKSFKSTRNSSRLLIMTISSYGTYHRPFR